MRLLVLLALVLPAIAVAQHAPDPADWRFAHPASTLAGSVRVKALLESPLLAAALEEATAQDPAVAAMAGMAKNAAAQITEIRFSLMEMGAGQMDALILVSGQFDGQLATMLSEGKLQSLRLDPDTVLLGTEPSLSEAASRMAAPPGMLKNRALARAATALNHDLWIAGNLPESSMTSGFNENLRGMALGLTLREDLAFELMLDAESQVMAENLVRQAVAAAELQPQLKSRLQALVSDTTAHFRLTVPGDEVLTAIREVAPMIPQAGNPAPRESASFPPPPPPRRNTIVIQGLGDSPREIPVIGAR
jgi:hypothetical protein